MVINSNNASPAKIFNVTKLSLHKQGSDSSDSKDYTIKNQDKQIKERASFGGFAEPQKIRSQSTEMRKVRTYNDQGNCEIDSTGPVIKIGVKRVFQEAFEPDQGRTNFQNAPIASKNAPSELQSQFSCETFQKDLNRHKARRVDEDNSRVFIKAVNPKASQLVKLNVGGTCIIVKRDTLTKKTESHLHSMFSEMNLFEKEHKEQESTTDTFDLQFNKLDDGSIFIDRNPKAFQLMIDYLKSEGDGADFLFASSRSQNKQEMLEQELAFWAIDFKNSADKPCKRLIEMQQIYSSEPQALNASILQRWRQLDPIDLCKVVKEEGLQFLNEGIIDDCGTDRPILFWAKMGRCTGQVFAGSTTKGKVGFVRANYKEGIYEGQYENGTLNGWGRAISQFGHYEGFFKDGRYNGRGVFYPTDGEPQRGFWKNDRLVENLPQFGSK